MFRLINVRSTIHAMALITGGGLTDTVIRVRPDVLVLDNKASTIVLPPVFEWLQREGAFADAKMWRTFNCVIGFVLVVPAAAAATVESDLDRLALSHLRTGAVGMANGGDRLRHV